MCTVSPTLYYSKIQSDAKLVKLHWKGLCTGQGYLLYCQCIPLPVLVPVSPKSSLLSHLGLGPASRGAPSRVLWQILESLVKSSSGPQSVPGETDSGIDQGLDNLDS